MAIGAILGVAQAGMGIASAFGSFNDQAAQAEAQNQALKQQYKQQLQIWDKTQRDSDQNYATRLGQYDLGMKAVDKAESAALGAIAFNRSERQKQATAQLINDYIGMAKTGGSAAAAGKTGKNATDVDASKESNFVSRQQYRLASLFGDDATDMMKSKQIANQAEGQRNQLWGQVAIAPTRSKAPLEPTQVSGPSTSSLALGIGSSLLQGANTFASMMPPDPGNLGGNSIDLAWDNSKVNWNDTSDLFMGMKPGQFFNTTIPGY